MRNWAALLFHTLGVAIVTYVSFRLALSRIFEANRFPNGLFLFGIALLLFGTLTIGFATRKYILSVSSNQEERRKLQTSFIVCTIATVWIIVSFFA